jgi:2-(1,2-epoxy-1,2-dihydrophenyl)acetyl-CoA isomerase
MKYDQITFEKKGRVGLITLNRPEKLNAWTGHMMGEMRHAMDSVADDPSVGAVAVTGAGRAFCAGADISSFAQYVSDADSGKRPTDNVPVSVDNWVRYIQKYPKPTLAAINGVAVGIGITQILPWDIRIASEQARIGFFFVKMALVPELASSHLLPQMVGMSRAIDWCLSGRMVSAKEACEAGLVREVVAPEALIERTLEIGEELAGNAAPAMLAIRQLLLENAHDTDIDSVMAREGVALAERRLSWEHREAIAAFAEKRAPNFARQ